MDVSGIDAEIANYHKRLKQLERSKANLERDIDDIHDNDRNAERKRKDMNRRLDGIYDEMTDIENSIAEREQMKASAEQKILTADTIYKMLLGFDQLFDKMDRADQRKLIETLISEVRLYPKEIWEKGKSPVKEIRYAFPVSDEVLEKLGKKLQPLRRLSCFPRERATRRSCG